MITCYVDMRKGIEDAIKYEVQKYKKENKETRDHEIYNQVEVLTPREIDALVYDKVTDVIESLDLKFGKIFTEKGCRIWCEIS